MKIEKWPAEVKEEVNIMVVMDRDEAIRTIRSLSTQLLEGNPNAGRVEMRYGKNRSAEFSIAVVSDKEKMRQLPKTKDSQQQFAAQCRWSVMPCPGCKVKGKHVRGYYACENNPDPDTWGFKRKNGK